MHNADVHATALAVQFAQLTAVLFLVDSRGCGQWLILQHPYLHRGGFLVI